MINKDKQYRTRDGGQVRIYATDGEPTAEVHGAYKSGEHWISSFWDKNGVFSCEDAYEMYLVEIGARVTREKWVNIYKDHETFHDTETEAEIARKDEQIIACVKVEIDCEEGEGL